MTTEAIDLFDEVFELPDPDRQRQYARLVGLEKVQARLLKDAGLLVQPDALGQWSRKHHGKELSAIQAFFHRPPLILFSGGVGTGKTTLAESFGDPLARAHKLSVRVFRLGLMTRGHGAVGEMTSLVTRAFAAIEEDARKAQASGANAAATILILDEADALVSSRATDQMHHEDRAGVNAVIRGIDRLTNSRLPLLVVMCTNRAAAIDPAIVRRAASHFTFGRPNDEQRITLFREAFDGLFTDQQLKELASLTGPSKDRAYGCTYSDLTTRLIPAIVLAAYPDRAIDFTLTKAVCRDTPPTKPFGTEG